MAEGNRKDPRARVLNMTVRYKSATVDEFIENHSHDISKGGIFIKTRSPFPAGTLLKFEVRIAEDQKLMHGVGRVVWRREPDRAEENFPAGMGIKFIKTGEGAAELISQIVATRQGEESSFDAGVREAGVAVSMPPIEVSADPGDAKSADLRSPAASDAADSDGAPSLQVESARGWPLDAETTVSSPPKKRQLAAEKRKVVLQGPALEGPASEPRPMAVESTVIAERAPSRETREKSTIADETTSPRVRADGTRARPASPNVYGLVAILGLVAFVAVVVNRLSEDEPTPPPAPSAATAPPIAPEPPEPVPPPEPAQLPTPEPPSTEASAAGAPLAGESDPSASPPAAASAPAMEPAAARQTPAAAAPAATAPAAPAATPAGTSPAAASPAARPPAAPARPSPPAAAPPAARAPVTTPPKPAAPARTTAESPAAPPGTAGAPSAPAPSAPAPSAPSDKAATDKRKPPAPTAPAGTAQPPPPRTDPAPAPAPPTGDDNPY